MVRRARLKRGENFVRKKRLKSMDGRGEKFKLSMTKDEFEREFIRDRLKYWNNFKTPTDRKYFLWNLLSDGFMEGADFYNKPYRIEKLIGSNQVILRRGNKVIYDSLCDNYDKNGFIKFVLSLFEFRRPRKKG